MFSRRSSWAQRKVDGWGALGFGCRRGLFIGIWRVLYLVGIEFRGHRVVVDMGCVVEDVENGGWKGGIHSILCLGCVCTK